VLLDALVDYGGTLVFVSHDRYFVERLATKIVEVGNGKAQLYPGTYAEFLWSKEHAGALSAAGGADSTPRPAATTASPARSQRPVDGVRRASASYEERRREEAERRKREKALKSLRTRIEDLESRIAEREARIKALEQEMSSPGFYNDHAKAKPVVDEHQSLMWEVGDLLNQWEMLQGEASAMVELES
jgi:ATP-binding cassette subfamily F protein 3